MRFSTQWPPKSSQSGVFCWPSLVARVFPVLEWLQLPSVPPVGSTPRLRGFFRCLWGSCSRSSLPGSLVFRVTGFQGHGSQHRSLSQSSTRNFSLLLWQLTSGVPYGSPNGSTSYQITAQWWKFCCLALQEPLPSCPWFGICSFWQLVTPSLSLPPQLEVSLTRSPTPCLTFSFSVFVG